MSEQEEARELKARTVKAKKGMMYLVLFAIVMFFAGLTSAYLVSKGGANYWVKFKLPAYFWWSTLFIVVSSLTFQMALIQARKDRPRAVAPWALLTLALGLGFSISQFKGWGQLFDGGYALVSHLQDIKGEYGSDFTIERRGEPLVKSGDLYFLPEDVTFDHPLNDEMNQTLNSASSYFYVLTYSHFAHVFGGLVALLFICVNALRGRYNKDNTVGLWAGTYYWHFLAGLWVYVLLFLVYIH